jgi:hypothetical protein
MLPILLEAQLDLVARWQLRALGWSTAKTDHHLATLRPVPGCPGVWTTSRGELRDVQRWHAATLTAPGRVLAGMSAARLWGFADDRRDELFVVVARCGRGPRRRHGGVLVCPSAPFTSTLHRGVPTLPPARVLVDLAWHVEDGAALRRMVLEALRVTPMTWDDLHEEVLLAAGRRGIGRLRELTAAIRGLPIARCRSNAEARALWRRRVAGRADVAVNEVVGGFEADLVDHAAKRIVEVDSGFHVDPEADAARDAAWRAAGYDVHRRPSSDAYDDDASW